MRKVLFHNKFPGAARVLGKQLTQFGHEVIPYEDITAARRDYDVSFTVVITDNFDWYQELRAESREFILILFSGTNLSEFKIAAASLLGV